MAVSTADAGAYPLSVGSSNNVGRSLAFGILFSKSIPHLRQQIRHALLNAVPTLRQFLLPIIKWLRPRNRTIVAMVAVVAFILHRYTNVKQKAEMAYRRKFWKAMMKNASKYEEWAHAAKMLDKEGPKVNEWDMYDEELVWNKLQELRNRRQKGSIRDIVFSLRADLIRNLGNMCNPDLHKGRLQVPKLINEYIDEVSFQLKMVCDSDSEDLPFEEKLIFMHETRHAFGRTALLLSGGASLGAFHIGVLRTLVEHKFLPRIIAGSSVGSVFCAMTATRTSSELQSFFDDSLHSMKFFDQMGGVYSVAKRVLSGGAVHDIRQLQMMLRQMTNNLTFQEAYDLTGQILGITVCSPRKHEPPRCLNYLTSPHVVIWSAVTASCAFPGLFEAQELMAKDRNGEIVPYHPPFNFEPEEGSSSNVRRWRDGSLEVDLPMMQLKELFNVNHFIVSQLNPHIAPLLRIKEFVRAHGGYFASKVAHIVELEVKHRCNQMLELGFPLGGLAKLFAQEWEGDVTIVMPATLSQYAKLIQNPSYMELKKAATQGRRCTWEKLAAIKANYGIELALDECVATLNHVRRLKRIAEKAAGSSRGLITAAKFSASRRIPSWNVLARENSTSSFEEDLQSVSDTTSVHRRYSGSGSSGRGPSSRFRHRRNLPEASDTESEINSVYSSSRFGGPLMRDAATDKFAHSVPNLDNDAEQHRGLMDHNSVTLQIGVNNPYHHKGWVAAPERGSEDTEFDLDDRVPTYGSCATRTEGDLLQPEGTNNELMFNVIKEEEHDGESYGNDVPECVQIDCHGHGKEIDGSSVSECGDDHVTATKV